MALVFEYFKGTKFLLFVCMSTKFFRLVCYGAIVHHLCKVINIRIYLDVKKRLGEKLFINTCTIIKNKINVHETNNDWVQVIKVSFHTIC